MDRLWIELYVLLGLASILLITVLIVYLAKRRRAHELRRALRLERYVREIILAMKNSDAPPSQVEARSDPDRTTTA